MLAAETPISMRSPTADELARIEHARQSLATAARWLCILAIYSPVLLGAGTCVYAWAADPGIVFDKVLGGLLVVLTIGGCLVLAVLLGPTRRTLTWHTRLERDRRSGFELAREQGEVGWGSDSYIATVAGKSLISPFYTRLAAIPGYWYQFELLSPGAYLFDLLPESRLVVSAEPIPRIEPEGARPRLEEGQAAVRRRCLDKSAAQAALLAAFGLRELDLAANREGRVTGRQRWRLAVSSSPYLLMAPLLLWACYLGLRETSRAPQLGFSFSLVVLGLITAIATVFAGRHLWDIVECEVKSTTGLVSFRYTKSGATGSIGGVKFTTSSRRARALQSGRFYRVYYFRRSRGLIGAEPG